MTNTLRSELETASALLHKVAAGTDLEAADAERAAAGAAAVDAILDPGGWTQIREEEGEFTTNLAVTTRASLRDALKKAAGMRRKTLTALVTQGFREVLEGTWTPPQRGKASRIPTGDKRAVLNVTIEDALRKRVQRAAPDLSEELGYPVTEGGIAMAYLLKELAPQLATLLPDVPDKPE